MRSRQEIKAIAKAAMKEQRATSILALLLVGLLAGAGGFVSGLFFFVPFFGIVLMYASIFFIGMPLAVNAVGIYIKIYKRQLASANELLSNFPINYLRKVGGMAWMMLFTMLWSLLFFIPGIIKGISYSMTASILADCPNVNAKQALKLSMRMTDGHKMDLFVMQLSFIGWTMLSMLTCGILSIVFVGPYMSTTSAGYYVELREKAIANGVIDRAELEGRLQ